MKKAILACILVIIALSMSSYAMDCSIMDTSACIEPNFEAIFTISDLADGGSHAVPDSVPGSFPKSVCCSGVAGLTAKAETSEPASFDYLIGYFADGHFNRTGSIPPFSTGLWLDAPTEIDCDYQNIDCTEAGYDTCLFTISEDSPGFSHVSGCGDTEYPFDTPNSWRYCCSSGEATCRITDIYWGVFRDNKIQSKVGTEPICGGEEIYLIVETSDCETGTQVDFTIKKLGAEFESFPTMDLGTSGGTPLCWEDETTHEEVCFPDIAIAVWEKAGSPPDVPPYTSGEFTFVARVHKDDEVPPVVDTDESGIITVDGNGGRADDPISYYLDECGEEEPQGCLDDPTCDGTTCADMDCDTVVDCVGGYMGTVADPSTVDRCGGGEAGTAGCVPAMDCTNLLWSECKNCEAGQDCDTLGGFDAGIMFMERQPCTGAGVGECDCFWDADRDDIPDPTAPPGCDLPGILNQYNNRFKACIEDEEFPFFDGFNVIAVLLVLSLYYTIVIVRKKK